MTALMPELEHQFAEAAERLAHRPSPTRAGRRRWPFGFIPVAVILATGTLGYAAQDIWRPVLGTDDQPRVAVGAAPDEPLLANFSVLRRPQTAADRGLGARYALRFPTNRRGVRTDYVRQVGTTPAGNAIVLLPVTNDTAATADADRSGDRLCLWVQDGDVGGGRSCRTTAQVIEGGIGSMMGNPADTPERRDLERDLAAARREAMRTAKPNQFGGFTLQTPRALMKRQAALGDPMHVVGIVPDDVVSVTIGHSGTNAPAPLRVPVHDNVYQADIDVSGPGRLGITWFDSTGRSRPGGLP